MKWEAYTNSSKSKKFLIKKDPKIGFYLYIFEEDKCIKDYLQDTFEIAVECAKEDYNIPENAWKLVEY